MFFKKKQQQTNFPINEETFKQIKQQFEFQQAEKHRKEKEIKRTLKAKPLIQTSYQVNSELETLPKRCPNCNSKTSRSDILQKEYQYIQLVKCKNKNCNFMREYIVSGG